MMKNGTRDSNSTKTDQSAVRHCQEKTSKEKKQNINYLTYTLSVYWRRSHNANAMQKEITQCYDKEFTNAMRRK